MDYINKEILNYRITNHIGEGGMADVYQAEHVKFSNRKAAVKILKPILTAQAAIRKRFEHEAEIMAKLEHPNIVHVYDFVDSEDILAIIMELLQGETLDSFIKRKKGLSKDIAHDMSLKILRAFDYAHGKSLVHRDVKPSNIFVEENKNIKIMDFGIAKLLDENLQLTSTGTQMGTPVYMSPEQVRDTKNIDQRSDLYSFGVMLHFMLQGSPPYDSGTESKFDIFNRIVKEPLPRLTKHLQFQPLIDKATAKNPADRYQNAAEFIEALHQLQSRESDTARNDASDKSAALKKYTELFAVFYEDRHISDAERRQLNNTQKELGISRSEAQKAEQQIIQSRQTSHNTDETQPDTGDSPDDDLTLPEIQEPKKPETKKPEQPPAEPKKKKRKALPWIIGGGLLVILIIVLATLTGEDSDWRKTQKAHTTEAYRQYLSDYPDGKYTAQAEESMDWLTAKQENNTAAYTAFKEQYGSQSTYADSVPTKIAALHYDSISPKITLPDMRQYLASKEAKLLSPDYRSKADSKLAQLVKDSTEYADNEALRQADKAAFDKAKRTNTESAYQNYIDKNPKGQYLADAQDAISQLKKQEDSNAWQKAKRSGTKTAYESYINQYPQGQYTAQARQAIKDINNRPKTQTGYFTDSRDGKRYKWVKIGKQTWMAENLNYTKGIKQVTDMGEWDNLNNNDAALCYYDNSTANGRKYGALYTYNAAKQACPNGWHLPSKAEYETLLNNYGGNSDYGANYKALIPGGSSGFSVLFGGYRSYYGNFRNLGNRGYFWSSSARDDTSAWSLSVRSSSEEAHLYYHDRSVGRSVRCLQD